MMGKEEDLGSSVENGSDGVRLVNEAKTASGFAHRITSPKLDRTISH